MTRVRVGPLADLDQAAPRKVDVGGTAVAVVRIGDDVYAVADTCSHEDYSLSEGEVLVDEREIECWKHGSTFSLLTGAPQCLPATHPIEVYVAVVDGGEVYVERPGGDA